MNSSTEIQWDAAATVADNAREKLPEMARQFFAAGRAAATLDSSLAALHRFRLQTKRLRYSLDLFRDYYGPGLEQRIEALRTLQDLLGAISDCYATRELLLNRDNPRPAARSRVLGILKKTTSAKVAAFRRHWQKDFSHPERELWWTDYLSRYARPRR